MTAADSRVGTSFGKYRFTGLLGKGGMGEVYSAYDTDKGRTVALKVLADPFSTDERFRMRFMQESRCAARLHEPHIIPIHDWGEIDGNLYIDMRLVPGSTLWELLEKGPLEPSRAVSIIGQIAAALDAAHAEGLIHRDIKPGNIIVTPDDFAYLLDFGIAVGKGNTRLTMAGTQIGSFAYMAPERFNDQEATPAADVYSLACVLYEALTGDTPFPADSLEHLVAAHLASAPPRPSAVNPKVPALFDDVIARGMAKEPDDRYGSAGALGRAARRALSSVSSDAPTHQRPVVLPPLGHTRPGPPPITTSETPPLGGGHSGGQSVPWLLPVVIAVATTLMLGAIGIVIVLLLQKNPPSPSPSPSTASPPPQPSTVTVPEPTTSQPAPPPSPAPSTWTPPPPADPVTQLRAIANGDRSFVSARFTGYWVPQLSSKRPGTFDDGKEWDNASILQEYLGLRQRYGAKLLWSGDWSRTFSASDYWVTVAPLGFLNSSDATAWCRDQGFDSDHCYATQLK